MFVEQPQKFAGSLRVNGVAFPVDGTHPVFDEAVEPCGFQRDVACLERDSQPAKPGAYRLVVAVMGGEEDAALSHFLQDGCAAFRKGVGDASVDFPKWISGGILGQFLVVPEQENDIGGVTGQILEHLSVKTS